ncbi:MAG: endonuclease/exonuclease/phosphatase family protein [Anaerolineales bacterium]
MKKQWVIVLSFGILFLLFVQSIATFIEGVYILELLSTSLDEKVLAVLFLFSPLILLLFGRRVPGWLIWISFLAFFLGRGLLPYLDTSGRTFAAGISTAAALILIPILLVTIPGKGISSRWLIPAQGLALAVGLSVLLRTVNFTLDISLTGEYSWITWFLGIVLGITLTQFHWEPIPQGVRQKGNVTGAGIGVMSSLTMFYFLLSSPGVIARWTEGSYALIILLVSSLSLLWLFSTLVRPDWVSEINSGWLLLWNIIFTISVLATILTHTISFPQTPESPAVVVGSPTWYQQIPLVLMLATFPVLFVDFGIFSGFVYNNQPTPRKMGLGFLLGSLLLVLSIFMNIFSNVWGYVAPISLFFRNKFWFAFLINLVLITVLVALIVRKRSFQLETDEPRPRLVWTAILLVAIFGGTFIAVLFTDRSSETPPTTNSLTVMTYNIQQANDVFGEKSYKEQLELIKEVNPDIVGLQESDSARISLGNNDYVRYYASKLGYYSYYGPKTVTGTYGTAILSRYPLEDPRSVFTYSDQDEIGTAEAEINVGNKEITVYNVHPDGSEEAKMVFARSLVERAGQKPDVIAIGDYNLRGWEVPYLLIDKFYKNAWMDVYPTGISDDGLDMSGENRIDHIFVSPHFNVENPIYLLPPESKTDHPAHWTEITWE